MSEQEEAALLESLDRAATQLDAGQGVPIDQVRGLVRKWASNNFRAASDRAAVSNCCVYRPGQSWSC